MDEARAARGHPRRSLADILASHMESEGTKGYTKRELRALFSPLNDLRIDKVRTSYDEQITPGPIAG